jgi:hypothetical protein
LHTVLGFATTQTAIEFVRIDESGADDARVTRESMRAAPLVGDTAADAYAHLVARVWFRMRRFSRVDEHPVRSVGVTWVDGADHEASLLVEALTDAGLVDVVAIETGEARRALARAAPQAQADLALGAAVAAADRARPPRTSAARSAWRHPPWRQTRTTAGLLACGLALLVSLSLSSELRHPSPHPDHPQVDTTPGGAVVVPVSSAPVPQAPRPEPPSVPAPDTAEVSLPPPAVNPEPPASAPQPAPRRPAPQAPPMPAPGNQISPAIPEPMPVEQAPPEPNCALLCGVTL